MNRIKSLASVMVCSTAVLVGCGGGGDTIVNGFGAAIDDVTVTPPGVTLEPGQTIELTADVTTSGNVEDLTVEWSSDSPGVVAAQRTGEFTARVTGQSGGSGSVVATATAANVAGETSGVALITVPAVEPEIDAVSVTPASIDIEVGQTATLSADVQTSGDIEGLTVDWSSANTSVATVQPTGDFTAQVAGESTGSVSISASVTADNVDGSQTASAGVTVQ